MDRFQKYVERVDELKKDDKNADIIQTYTKLKLYGLYKQSTVGDINTPQPGVFNFTSRSKWNAWNENEGMTSAAAMELYICTVKQITRSILQ